MAIARVEFTARYTDQARTPGSWVRLNAKFYSLAGAVVAPSSGEITFRVALPSGNVDVYVGPGGVDGVVADADGFHIDVEIEAQGTHRCRVEAAGTADAAGELEFQGGESAFFTSIPRLLNEPLGPGSEGDLLQFTDGRWQPASSAGTMAAVGTGTEPGERTVTRGLPYFWHKERFWYTPNYDKTGVVDATEIFRTAIAELNASRPGGCLYVPESVIRVGTGYSLTEDLFEIQPGMTVTGPERGMRLGHRHYAPLAQAGALFRVYGGQHCFKLKYDSSLFDIEGHYPNQAVSGSSPTAYGYFIYNGANEHGACVANITAINPYKYLYTSAGGMHIEKLIGFPLNEGIHLARCPDVIRIRDVHFNPANDSSLQQSLIDHVHATGRAVVIDGAEGYDFSGLFAHSYDVGYQFVDEDADGAASYGRVTGGGLEGINVCIHVAATTGLVAIGGKFHQVGLVPEIGAGHHAVLCADNFTPSDDRRNPRLSLIDCSVHSGGAGTDRPIWVQANSHAQVSWSHSVFHTFINEGARNDSVDGSIVLDDVVMPAGTVRTGGTGITIDRNGRDGDGTMASHDGCSFGAQLTDADATINWDGTGGRALPDNTITALRILDIDDLGGEVQNQAWTIYVGSQAHAYRLRDHVNATLITLPAGTRHRIELIRKTHWEIDRVVQLAL